ncbi:hypothetical protein BaRGS_00023854, partial [Batillaria attramentaria]
VHSQGTIKLNSSQSPRKKFITPSLESHEQRQFTDRSVNTKVIRELCKLFSCTKYGVIAIGTNRVPNYRLLFCESPYHLMPESLISKHNLKQRGVHV